MPRPTVPSVDSLKSGAPLTFLQPEQPSPNDLPSPSDLPNSQPDPWSSSSPSTADTASEAPFDAPASSRGSSASSMPKARVQEASRKAVLMAGEGAHQLLAHDEWDEQVDLYRADEKDAAGIGDPVGAIVHRHGLLGAAANPDVMDGINALVGLAVYGWKQVERYREARRLRKAQRQAEQAGTEQTDEPGPTAPVELDTPAWVNR